MWHCRSATPTSAPYSHTVDGPRSLGSMHSLGILAHQGGWDEIAMVAGPIVVFAALLAVARRRAVRHLPATPTDRGDD